MAGAQAPGPTTEHASETPSQMVEKRLLSIEKYDHSMTGLFLFSL